MKVRDAGLERRPPHAGTVDVLAHRTTGHYGEFFWRQRYLEDQAVAVDPFDDRILRRRRVSPSPHVQYAGTLWSKLMRYSPKPLRLVTSGFQQAGSKAVETQRAAARH